MPQTVTPGRKQFPAALKRTAAQQQAAASNPTTVVVDPRGIDGDAAHGHATFVMGWLGTICGINHYGAASFTTGSWVRL